MDSSYIDEEALQSTINLVSCYADFSVVGYEIKIKNGKPDFVVYKVDVVYGDNLWTIFRKYSQFTQLDGFFKKDIRGYSECLPPKPKDYKTVKFDNNFLRERQRIVDEYMQILCSSRGSIFAGEFCSVAFTRFIAPIQLGDIKGPGFILPFKLEF